MNKTFTTTLLILASGLTLNTTALAAPFTHGSGYVNAISNADSNTEAQSVRSVARTETIATTNGFNDRDTAGNENVTVASRTVVETPMARMFSIITSGFNDRS